ncbi:hypothetical protein Micbo1qcDRAFT_160696, partial [Microdochium bolleyi]
MTTRMFLRPTSWVRRPAVGTNRTLVRVVLVFVVVVVVTAGPCCCSQSKRAGRIDYVQNSQRNEFVPVSAGPL